MLVDELPHGASPLLPPRFWFFKDLPRGRAPPEATVHATVVSAENRDQSKRGILCVGTPVPMCEIDPTDKLLFRCGCSEVAEEIRRPALLAFAHLDRF